MNAQSQLDQGIDLDELDMSYIEEVACANASREVAETYHGDSQYFADIQAIASAAGPPSTHTNLPNNGAIFNTRSIASSASNHRAVNNRLTDADRSSSTSESRLRPEGVNTVSNRKNQMAAEDRDMAEAMKRSQETHAEESEKRKRLSGVVSTARKNLQYRPYQPEPAELPTPSALTNTNLNFLTQSQAATGPTPINSAIQKKPMAAINLRDSDEEDNHRVRHECIVENLVDRALERSFGDSMSSFDNDGSDDDYTAAAVNRVSMITDKREKALELTSLFVSKKGNEVDSPQVCRMLDTFNKQFKKG